MVRDWNQGTAAVISSLPSPGGKFRAIHNRAASGEHGFSIVHVNDSFSNETGPD